MQRIVEPGHELELRQQSDRRLVAGEVVRVHLPDVVHALDVLVDEHAFPRHQHVVEDDDRIHLVEPRGERMVIGVSARQRLAAHHPQPLGVRRDRKGDRVLLVLGRMLSERPHEDLVRVRSGGRQHLRPADDQALLGLAHDAEVRVGIRLLRRRLRPIDLRVDQRMSEEEILVPHESEISPDVIGIVAEETSVDEPRGQHRAHEVRRSTHDSEGRLRPGLMHEAALEQVGCASRHQERVAVDPVGVRANHGLSEPRIVLQVVELRDRSDRRNDRRMLSHVRDPFPAEPRLGRAISEPLHVLVACPNRHGPFRLPITRVGAATLRACSPSTRSSDEFG